MECASPSGLVNAEVGPDGRRVRPEASRITVLPFYLSTGAPLPDLRLEKQPLDPGLGSPAAPQMGHMELGAI